MCFCDVHSPWQTFGKKCIVHLWVDSKLSQIPNNKGVVGMSVTLTLWFEYANFSCKVLCIFKVMQTEACQRFHVASTKTHFCFFHLCTSTCPVFPGCDDRRSMRWLMSVFSLMGIKRIENRSWDTPSWLWSWITSDTTVFVSLQHDFQHHRQCLCIGRQAVQ